MDTIYQTCMLYQRGESFMEVSCRVYTTGIELTWYDYDEEFDPTTEGIFTKDVCCYWLPTSYQDFTKEQEKVLDKVSPRIVVRESFVDLIKSDDETNHNMAYMIVIQKIKDTISEYVQ